MHPAYESMLRSARSHADLERLLQSWLEYVVDVTVEDGQDVFIYGRARIGVYNGLEIHVYSNDHQPPHFHVKTRQRDLRFLLSDCTPYNCDPSAKDYKCVRAFYAMAKDRLLGKWDQFHGGNA